MIRRQLPSLFGNSSVDTDLDLGSLFLLLHRVLVGIRDLDI